MALDPNRTRLVRFDVDRVISRNNRVVARVMQRLASEMESYVKARITANQSPPRSKPGQYPHRDTGHFSETLEIVPKGRAIVVRTINRGIWLETGTRAKAKKAKFLPIPVGRGGTRKTHRERRSRGPGGMAPRPWLTLAIFRERDRWRRRATAIAKEETAVQ